MTDLWRLTAVEAVRRLKRGEVSPLEMIDAAAARIATVEPRINAIPTLCIERAREHARRLMAHPPAEPPPHYLHGLPVAVKDNTDVAGVRCTFGSRVHESRIAAASDPVVQRLEANGAVVIGKSNLPEFAAGGNTFNDVFGATRNPWNTALSAGGSSGGAAAALAAGEVWLATGNDFGGSIRVPASFCSVVGMRPSPGRVPRVQKQPFSPLSVEGPMARTVADCALMLDAEAGEHRLDPLSLPLPAESFSAAAGRPRRPARVAFSVDLGIAPAVDREVAAVCRAAVERLAADGVAVEETHPPLADAAPQYHVLRGAVFIARFRDLMATHRATLKPEIVGNYERGIATPLAEVIAAEIAQGEVIRRVARFMEDYDLLLAPAAICPPFPVGERYCAEVEGVPLPGYMDWMVLVCAITFTACPVLALPCGFTRDGRPVGLQVIGAPRSEAALFSHGAYLEALWGLRGRLPAEPS
jgi:amidase